MNLTPEQKAEGEKQFQQAVGITRRDFLKQGVLAAGIPSVGVGAFYFGYSKVNNPVRVGVIGTGDEGGVLMSNISPEYIQVVAIADIRPYNQWRAFHGDQSSETAYAARMGLMNKYGWKTEDEARKHVKVYKDKYEELLDDPDVEAVIIALPLHLHHEAAIAAMQKGKHVLTEKLMAHSIQKGKQMAKVSRDTDLLLATGHQRHYSVLYDDAQKTIQAGVIGDVHHIRAQWHRGNLPGKDSWQPDLPAEIRKDINKYRAELESGKISQGRADSVAKRLATLEKQVLDETVDAAAYGYQEMQIGGRTRTPLEELIRWRLWNRTGGGLMAELGSHQLDAASIFVSCLRNDGKKVHPLTVTGVGGRHIFPADRECDDHVYCTYEFPGPEYESDPNKKIVVTYSSINGNGYGGYGEVVMGTEGTLILEKEQQVILIGGKPDAGKTKVDLADGPLDTTESPGAMAVAAKAVSGAPSRGYTEEMEHWAWCIRNRAPENLPRCHPEVALADAVIALTSNIAMRKNRTIEFKKEWFDLERLDRTPEIDLESESST